MQEEVGEHVARARAHSDLVVLAHKLVRQADIGLDLSEVVHSLKSLVTEGKLARVL